MHIVAQPRRIERERLPPQRSTMFAGTHVGARQSSVGARSPDSPTRFDLMSDIDVLLNEDRTFPPSDAFARAALTSTADLYAQGAADFEAFWAEQALRLDWFTPWKTVLRWEPPRASWVQGGTLNVAHNCIDRHVASARRQ